MLRYCGRPKRRHRQHAAPLAGTRHEGKGLTMRSRASNVWFVVLTLVLDAVLTARYDNDPRGWLAKGAILGILAASAGCVWLGMLLVNQGLRGLKRLTSRN